MFNKLKSFIMSQLAMCLFFWDTAGGVGGGGPDANGNPPGGNQPDGNPVDPKTMTLDDIKGVIAEVAKTATAEQIEGIKKEFNEINRKSVFPYQDGNFGDGEVSDISQESILDTKYFSKFYAPDSTKFNKFKSIEYPWLPEGMALGNELKNSGGPWKRLSPEMETFAKAIKMKGSIDSLKSAGIDIPEHNNKVKDKIKQAGMSEGVLADGGVYVPIEFWQGTIEFAIEQSPILNQIWRIQMNSNIMYLPRLVQAAGSYFGGIQFYTPDEGGKKEDTKPEFERLQIQAAKLVAVVYLTDELIQDSMINIVNYVTGLFVRGFQYELERRVIAGTGAAGTPCLGVINDPAINIVNRNTAGTVTYQDIINLDNALDENSTNLAWATRKVTQNTLLGLRDANNRPIFMADYGVFTGQPLHPSTMITYPVYRTRNIPAMGTQGDLILGDFSWYLLGIRQDLRIDQSEHVRFLYDEQTLRFVMRLDGTPAISIAFAILGDVES